MTLPIAIGPADVLIVVDPQVDFCAGGGLPVQDGSAVMPVINRLASKFANVVLTQDWHPADHLSFASSHPGATVFGTTMMPYGMQVLWPDHCIQGTPGAAFNEGLEIPHAGLVLRSNYLPLCGVVTRV
jgi:nicotinamidase/pyrazinamidase